MSDARELKELIKSLNDDCNTIPKENCEDYDFGEVLKFNSSETVGHKLRYSNGKEYIFSFDD